MDTKNFKIEDKSTKLNSINSNEFSKKEKSIIEINSDIINELKNFPDTAVSEKKKYCSGPRDFIRNRILTFKVLVCLLINTLKRSLSVELNDFFDRNDANTCTKQAFSKQRSKLKPLFFHDWNQVFVNSFYQHYAKRAKQWKGFYLWAVDGTTVPLPETGEILEKYGGTYPDRETGEKTSASARVGVLYDVLNKIYIKGMICPYSTSEETICPDLPDETPVKDKLILFDRGYPSFWLMYLLIHRGGKFVIRAPKNANKKVEDFLACDDMDITVDLFPSHKSQKRLRDLELPVSKKDSIKVRPVKVLLNTGEVEVLMTNLYDSQEYSIKDMKEVYSLRWQIETFYRYIKEELQLGQFSGIRPLCIEQDFAAGMFLFNLQCIIENQSDEYLKAVSRKRNLQYKINKNVAWGTLKHRVFRIFTDDDPYRILLKLQHLFEAHLEPVRPDRKYPVIRKAPRVGKYFTLTNYKRAV